MYITKELIVPLSKGSFRRTQKYPREAMTKTGAMTEKTSYIMGMVCSTNFLLSAIL